MATWDINQNSKAGQMSTVTYYSRIRSVNSNNRDTFSIPVSPDIYEVNSILIIASSWPYLPSFNEKFQKPHLSVEILI